MTAPNAPDPATVVRDQMFPPGPVPRDAITMYDGAVQAKNGFASWKAWDLRGPILKMAWDLLRFQLIGAGKPNADRTVPYGLRDSVNRIMYQTDQNNQILRKMAQVAGIDITDITSQ